MPKLAPLSIMATRFLPMSWRSPCTVPITAVYFGLMPAAASSGSRMPMHSFIARAAINISGTKTSLFFPEVARLSANGIVI